MKKERLEVYLLMHACMNLLTDGRNTERGSLLHE
jgi:hypothetical protein